MASKRKHSSDERTTVTGRETARKKLSIGNELGFEVTSRDIRHISYKTNLMRDDLHQLYLELDINGSDIERVTRNADTNDFRIQSTKILEFWKQSKGHDATRSKIIEALEECEFVSAQEKLLQIWTNVFEESFVEEETTGDAVNNIPNQNYKTMKWYILDGFPKEKLEKAKFYLKRDRYDLKIGIPESAIDEIKTVEHLLKCLEMYRLLGPLNLIYLPLLLDHIRCKDLQECIDRYAELTRPNKLDLLHLYDIKKDVRFGFLLEIRIRGDIKHLNFNGYTVEEYRKLLASNLGIGVHNVRLEALGYGSLVIFFLLPLDVKDRLRVAAKSKALWLTEANITALRIGNEQHISLTADDEDICRYTPPEKCDAAERTVLLRSGETPIRTIKLYLVGDPAKGKSTLKKSLSAGLVKQFLPFQSLVKRADYIPTPGINVEEKKVRGAGSFMIWDTAGQVEFHINHAMLLDARRGIFLVLYNCCDMDAEQTKQVKYWACFIKTCHDPTEPQKPRLQLVGTNIDSVQDKKTATAVFHKHLQYLKTVFGDQMHISEEVILVDGRQARSEGLTHLKDVLNKLAEPLRGELTPKICDEISKRIGSWCGKTLPLLHYTEFKQKVRGEIDEGVTDETLRLAVRYLHNMGEVHHAKLRSREGIIIVHPNWLTTTIFAPIFAPPNFRADYPGLPLYQEYTIEDLRCYFTMENCDLLIDLLEYFELAYRNEDGTFIIPAKLPLDTPEVAWYGESKTYFGRRIACRHDCDMFSTDVFPCLQVSMMNRYRRENMKPLLSRFGVKVFGEVEGMAQLTRDKRAVYIAVRVNNDSEINKGRHQLQEMESLVFEQIDERSKGTKVSTLYLSPGDLKMSTNLEDGVSFYTESALQEAIKKRTDLVHPATLIPESTFNVNPSISDSDVPNIENYAKVCEGVHVLCYSSLPSVQASVEAWHQGQQQKGRPCLNSIHCRPHKKPTTKSGACQPCVDWGKAVESVCFPFGKGVEWRNVTVSLFHKDPVEVAKAFLFKIPPGQILTKFGDFDVGGVLKLMMGFREYHHGDKACYDKMGKVLGIRNTLSHMKVEDNMMIEEKQLDESLDAIVDVVTSLKTHQPTLKDDEIKSKLTQIRQSRVTPTIMSRATDDLSDSLRQALDEWLDENKKGIAEAVWEDPHSQKLEQDVNVLKEGMEKLLVGAQKSN